MQRRTFVPGGQSGADVEIARRVAMVLQPWNQIECCERAAFCQVEVQPRATPQTRTAPKFTFTLEIFSLKILIRLMERKPMASCCGKIACSECPALSGDWRDHRGARLACRHYLNAYFPLSKLLSPLLLTFSHLYRG